MNNKVLSTSFNNNKGGWSFYGYPFAATRMPIKGYS